MARLWLVFLLSLLGLVGCTFDDAPIPGYVYECGTDAAAAFDYSGGEVHCGADDALLAGLEPTRPTEDQVCETLVANKSFPDENDLDTKRVQDALDACLGRVVKLVADGENNAFITSHILIDGVVLWIDEGVW